MGTADRPRHHTHTHTRSQVFELEPPPGAERQRGGEVVKIICKTMIRSVRDLRQLQRIWQIMQMLSGRWQHPNIARSFQLYNSPTRSAPLGALGMSTPASPALR